MDLGTFYFIDDSYFKKFKKCGLMLNKETVNGKEHNRPCYYTYQEKNSPIYWVVPISSQVPKYKGEYQIAIDKYGICDGISFGYVLGENTAFLIQNICPVTDKYITNQYIDNATSKPVGISPQLQKELNAKIRKVIRFMRTGKKIVLTNIEYLEKELLKELNIAP